MASDAEKRRARLWDWIAREEAAIEAWDKVRKAEPGALAPRSPEDRQVVADVREWLLIEERRAIYMKNKRAGRREWDD